MTYKPSVYASYTNSLQVVNQSLAILLPTQLTIRQYLLPHPSLCHIARKNAFFFAVLRKFYYFCIVNQKHRPAFMTAGQVLFDGRTEGQ